MKNKFKIIFLIFYLLNLGSCKKNACDDGVLNAESDAKKGVYKLYSYGMPDYEDWDFQNFYEDFVYENYNIKIGNAGCVITEKSECYSNRMKVLIFDKFGSDIFEKAILQAKAKYPKVKLQAEIDKRNNLIKKIDSDFIFSSSDIDTKPKFKGGEEKFYSYLKNELKNINDLTKKVGVLFVIEKNGTISNVEIKRGSTKYDEEIIEVFLNTPNWTPATLSGKKVRTRMQIPLIFKKN